MMILLFLCLFPLTLAEDVYDARNLTAMGAKHPLVLEIGDELTEIRFELLGPVFIELHLVILFSNHTERNSGYGGYQTFPEFRHCKDNVFGFLYDKTGDLFDRPEPEHMTCGDFNGQLISLPVNKANPGWFTLSLLVTRRGRVYGNGKYVGTLNVRPFLRRLENGLEAFLLNLHNLKKAKLYFQSDLVVRGVSGGEEIINGTSVNTTESPVPGPSQAAIDFYDYFALSASLLIALIGMVLSSSVATGWACCILRSAYSEGQDQLADEKYFGEHVVLPKTKTVSTKSKRSKKDAKSSRAKSNKESKAGGTKSTAGEDQKSDYKTAHAGANQNNNKSSYVTAEDAESNIQI
ncbi:unnamed protein product [Bursaphelenchus xylophilus]|uniref:(pine wood nematode) hypothetical protein n=1 Tax=Bursaphelenchus xylophilus TaxID=6326 RepID=A0A1I7RTK7_BURXY|nr:unnamed protein product [Bursaphelenchus xylophilus]CAG9122368.1 unnamed protein product [Bursaphelenchus xylophilus]